MALDGQLKIQCIKGDEGAPEVGGCFVESGGLVSVFPLRGR